MRKRHRIITSELRNSLPHFCRIMMEAFTELTERWAIRMEKTGLNSPRVLTNLGTRTVPQQKRIEGLHNGATRHIHDPLPLLFSALLDGHVPMYSSTPIASVPVKIPA